MKIFKQILKEFWFPLILAVLWTIYNIYVDENRGGWPVQKIVNTFGPTFFLLSWVTGQFFRVKKQAKVEDSFGSVEVRFNELIDKLEAKAEETISHISGGGSYPMAQFCGIGPPNNWGLIVRHHGSYPLYDVTVRITDLRQLAQAKDSSSISAAAFGTMKHVGNMIPTQSNIVFAVDVKDYSELSFNIFFTARNGLFSQLLRIKKINDSWVSAIKGLNKDGDIIFEHVEELFPRDSSGNVNW
ncbi:hypothetical protein [Cellvibrio mixtus]|uniref:hypothetical protein n=1 Tax=Cellvibrio mixtus TaxID=39650 RepID=UPI0005868A39|nr:hypothetical protein [Cellvibrio mixtus]